MLLLLLYSYWSPFWNIDTVRRDFHCNGITSTVPLPATLPHVCWTHWLFRWYLVVLLPVISYPENKIYNLLYQIGIYQARNDKREKERSRVFNIGFQQFSVSPICSSKVQVFLILLPQMFITTIKTKRSYPTARRKWQCRFPVLFCSRRSISFFGSSHETVSQ